MEFTIDLNQDYIYWKDEDGAIHAEPITSENVEEISRLQAARGY